MTLPSGLEAQFHFYAAALVSNKVTRKKLDVLEDAISTTLTGMEAELV